MDRIEKNLLSIKKAANYIGVSATTLRRWHDNQTFLATFVSPGGHRYYSMSDLEKKTKGIFRLAEEWVNARESFTPPQDFYCATSDTFKLRHERMTNELHANTLFRETASLISSAAGEIGNNSFDHNLGNWPDVNGVFFAYDVGKRVIVLADRGVGILTTLRRIRPSLQTEEEALRVAFTEYITGRAPEHRGNGLKYVIDALTSVHAELFFQSGDAILELKTGKTNFMMKKSTVCIHGSLSQIHF